MMPSYTITEEPVQPVMFKRLYQEARAVDDGPGPQVIVYIENKKRVFVRDSPHFIQGIADLLKIQGIPYRTYQNEEIEKIDNLFEGLEVLDGKWYTWHCYECKRSGRTTIKEFQCHEGYTLVEPEGVH